MFTRHSQNKYDTEINITLRTGKGEPFKLKTKFETEVGLYRTGKEWLGEIIVRNNEFESESADAVGMGNFAQYFAYALNQVFFYLDKNGFINELENHDQISKNLDKRMQHMEATKRFAPDVRKVLSHAFTHHNKSALNTAAKKIPLYHLALPPVFNLAKLNAKERELVGKYYCNAKLIRYPDRKGSLLIECKVYRQLLSKNENGTEIKIDFVPTFSGSELNMIQNIYERLYKAATNTPLKLKYAMSFVCRIDSTGKLLQNTGYLMEQLSEKVFCSYKFMLTRQQQPIENKDQQQHQATTNTLTRAQPPIGWSVFDGLHEIHVPSKNK